MRTILPELIAWLDDNYDGHPNVQRVECQLTSSIEYRVKMERRLYLIGHYEIVETGHVIGMARMQFALGKTRILSSAELQEIQQFLKEAAVTI
jgi:hypothetical protein